MPTNTKRYFRGQRRPEIFPIGEDGKECNKMGRKQSQITGTINASMAKGGNKLKQVGNIDVKPVLTPDRVKIRQNGRRIKENGEPSFTLTGQDIHGVKIDSNIRRLTPVECERLQGFPDNWTAGLSDTQRYKTLGNAVSVPVVKAVAEKLIKYAQLMTSPDARGCEFPVEDIEVG